MQYRNTGTYLKSGLLSLALLLLSTPAVSQELERVSVVLCQQSRALTVVHVSPDLTVRLSEHGTVVGHDFVYTMKPGEICGVRIMPIAEAEILVAALGVSAATSHEAR